MKGSLILSLSSIITLNATGKTDMRILLISSTNMGRK